MRTYRTGGEFELDIFGRSVGRDLFKRFGSKKTDFGDDIKAIIQSTDEVCPPTKIGECLYRQTAKEISRLGVNPEDLVFLPTVDTREDLLGVDGFLCLPSIPNCFVSVDLLNIDISVLLSLREIWIDSYAGEFYSSANFQSDLFNHKEGLSEWKRNNKSLAEFYVLGWESVDFRQYTKGLKRPENHFILTPYQIGTYRRRREFAKMAAEYFAKVCKEPSRENMAPLSH